MKLKKIASLALAGLMAVGMLAGCSGAADEPTDDGNTVAASSLSSSFVSELGTGVAASSSADAALTAQLQSFVNKNSDDSELQNLLKNFPDGKTQHSWMEDDFKTIVKAGGTDFSKLMDNIVVGQTYTAVKLYAYNASVSDEAIVSDLAAILGSSISALPKSTSVDKKESDKTTQVVYDCTYTISVVSVEKSLSNTVKNSLGRTVKYVAVMISGVANK